MITIAKTKQEGTDLAADIELAIKEREEYLNKVGYVEFDEQTHSYAIENKELISCTQLLQEMGLTEPYPYTPDIERARTRGTIIHKQVEEIIRNERGIDIKPESEILAQAIIKDTYNFGDKFMYTVVSEHTVANCEYGVAGRADVMYIPNVEAFKQATYYNQHCGRIIDIKTGKKPDFWAAAWQLSIYRYLSKPLWLKTAGADLAVLYLGGEGHDVAMWKDVSNWIPEEEIVELLEAYKNGTPYDKGKVLMIRDAHDVALQAQQYMFELEELQERQVAVQAVIGSCKKRLLETMKKHGLTNVKFNGLSITNVDGYFRKNIDTKALKEEEPEIAAKYTKLVEVEPSLRLKDERTYSAKFGGGDVK